MRSITSLADWMRADERCRLLSIKKITVQKRLAVKLDFTLLKGSHALKLWFISDSYTGCDQVRLSLAVGCNS